MRMLPQGSVGSSFVRRRNVAGASNDLLAAVANRAFAASNFLARVEHATDRTEAVEAATQYERDNAADDRATQRSEMLNEIRDRLNLDSLDQTGGMSRSPWMAVLQKLTFLNFLASPAQVGLTLLQPMQVSVPYLAARYGAQALGEFRRAVSTVSPGGGIVQGARASFASMAKGGRATSYIDQVKARIASGNAADKADVTRMLDELIGRRVINDEAGQDLANTFLGKGGASRYLDKALEWSRVVNQAAEVQSRSVVAVAAYRLARNRGKTHEQATEAAYKAVAETLFVYTAENSAKFMDPRRSGPVLQAMMTFRRHAQGMFALMGSSIHASFNKELTADERREARLTMLYLMGATTALAGTTGLPLEIVSIPLAVMAFALGYDEPPDLEKLQRQVLADMFGREVGEVIAKGLPRIANLDLSSRVGLNSLIAMKELRDFKPETVSGYLADYIGGAPLGTVLQMFRAANFAREGDLYRAVEAGSPVKMVRDTLQAGRLFTQGVTLPNGTRIDQGQDFNAWEAALKVAGFGSGRVAELYEYRNAVNSANREVSKRRQELMREWRQAETSQQRNRAMQRVQEWNRSQRVEGAKISMSQLIQSQRREGQQSRAEGGVYLPRNRQGLAEAGSFANISR